MFKHLLRELTEVMQFRACAEATTALPKGVGAASETSDKSGTSTLRLRKKQLVSSSEILSRFDSTSG
jgi:hypothetical protein